MRDLAPLVQHFTINGGDCGEFAVSLDVLRGYTGAGLT